jgi:AbrB family looped-hinge helix DNA binding protein
MAGHFASDYRGLDIQSNTQYGNTMKVTIKGQVTIPARIREYLGIVPHADVDFHITRGTVVLAKHEASSGNLRRFHSLRGVLKGNVTTRQWMRETRGE